MTFSAVSKFDLTFSYVEQHGSSQSWNERLLRLPWVVVLNNDFRWLGMSPRRGGDAGAAPPRRLPGRMPRELPRLRRRQRPRRGAPVARGLRRGARAGVPALRARALVRRRRVLRSPACRRAAAVG